VSADTRCHDVGMLLFGDTEAEGRHDRAAEYRMQ
jgi:hypothetical protein